MNIINGKICTEYGEEVGLIINKYYVSVVLSLSTRRYVSVQDLQLTQFLHQKLFKEFFRESFKYVH
jgi:hypothetical protein